METSKKLTGEKLSAPTLSAEVTHVSLSAQQANDKGQTTLDICGLGLGKPLASYDPDTRLWKMFGDISLWGDSPSLENLPPSGMTQNGELFLQPAWEPIIKETEYLSWPTPRAAQSETRNHTVYARFSEKPQNLENRLAQRDPSLIGGKLNPTWVEWLMGFPTGWTDLKDSETP